MATNTQMNIGIRRNFATLGDRNFEPSGTVLYKSNRENLNFLGTIYNSDASLTFDVGGVSYSANALSYLEFYWNQGFIYPTT